MPAKPSSSQAQSKSASSKIYIMAWIGLAGIGVAYLIHLLSDNQFTDTIPQARNLSDFENISSASEKALRIAERATKSTWPLHNDVALLKRDMIAIESRVSHLEKEGTKLANQVRKIENEFKLTTSAIPRPTGKPLTQPKSYSTQDLIGKLGAANVLDKTRMPIKIKYLPLPEDGFGDTAPTEVKLRIPSGDDAKGNKKQVSRTLFGVHLGSAGSIAAVKKNWIKLKRQNEKILSPLDARYLTVGSVNGYAYQLIAGPFMNVLEAVRVCAAMRAVDQFCEQTVFDGKPL